MKIEYPDVEIDCKPEYYSKEHIPCSNGHGNMTIYHGVGLYSKIAKCDSCDEYRYKMDGKWLERGETK